MMVKGIYICPRCGENDWEPRTWGDIPSDKCNHCGYVFTTQSPRIQSSEGKANE